MTPKEPPGLGPGPNGYDRYVRLATLHICETCPPDLGIDEAWCEEIEPGVRANGQLEPIGATPCPHGWAVAFKYHLYTVLARIHKDNPGFVVWIRQRAYIEKSDHLLDEWIENHHRPIPEDVLREKFIRPLLKEGKNQAQAAKKLGLTPQRITMALHPEKYGPDARKETSTVEVENRTPVAPSPSDGQPVPSPSNLPPQLGGTKPPPISLTPETPPETGLGIPPPALGGSKGGDGADVVRVPSGPKLAESRATSAVSEPPSFLSHAPPSPLRAFRERVEGLQGTMKSPEWEDALADESTARAARALLASLDASIFDFRAFLEDGKRTKDGPLPRAQVFALKIMDEVRIRTEENGHRAWVMAHLPGGKANLRVLRGKEKTMEIHLERDLIPVERVGAKA